MLRSPPKKLCDSPSPQFYDQILDDDFVPIQIYISEARMVGLGSAGQVRSGHMFLGDLTQRETTTIIEFAAFVHFLNQILISFN